METDGHKTDRDKCRMAALDSPVDTGAEFNLRIILVFALWLLAFACRAEVCVTDDSDRQLCLDAPAERIVALSPAAVELLYAAGAGDRVVAAVSFSDYPDAAKALPRVGSYDRIDLEAVMALKPDLVVGWISGNPIGQLHQLERLGLHIFYSEIRRLDDIAATLERFGVLTGSERQARRRATDFRDRLDQLSGGETEAAPVSVFYQAWETPLVTVNGEHLISEVIGLCGGVNVFGDQSNLAPRVSTEAVIAADPEIIVAGGMGEANRKWLNRWRRFEGLTAVRRDNLFFVPPSSIQRPTPRILEGAKLLCHYLETARERR